MNTGPKSGPSMIQGLTSGPSMSPGTRSGLNLNSGSRSDQPKQVGQHFTKVFQLFLTKSVNFA